jgi:hypothetical protein
MTSPDVIRHLEPSQSAGKRFVQRGLEGPVVMLNLLRFREVADYSASPELAPAAPISGAQAFDRCTRCPYCAKAAETSCFSAPTGRS